MRRPRSLIVAASLTALVLLATGCYGPVDTTTTALLVHCAEYFDTGPPVILGTFTVSVTVAAPTWSNPGEIVPITVGLTDTTLENLPANGAPVTMVVYLTLSGMTVPDGFGNPNTARVSAVLPPSGPMTFPTIDATFTAPPSGSGQVSLSTSDLVSGAFPTITCDPTSTVPLADIKTVGPPVTTAAP